MQIPFTCYTCCYKEKIPYFIFPVEINSSGIYDVECPNGHEVKAVVENPLYELLFDSGLYSLTQKFYLESTLGFCSSVERMYEYSIRVFLQHSRVDNEEVEYTWRNLKNSSERQYGAFQLLYLQSLKKTPPSINTKWISFRNDCIHKGNFPDRISSFEYGELIFNHIKETISSIRNHLGVDLTQTDLGKTIERKNFLEKYKHTSQIFLPTSLTPNTEEYDVISFDSSLNSMESHLKHLYRGYE